MYQVFNVSEGWVMGKGFTYAQAVQWMNYLISKGTGDQYTIVRM